MLIGPKHRQLRILVRLPGERRRDEITVVLQIVRLGMGVAGNAGQAIGETVAIRLLMRLLRPPGLLWPKSTEAGPRMTSTRSSP